MQNQQKILNKKEMQVQSKKRISFEEKDRAKTEFLFRQILHLFLLSDLILASIVKFQALEFKHLYFCNVLANQISLVFLLELLFSFRSFYYNI